jgi:hypothetical protein
MQTDDPNPTPPAFPKKKLVFCLPGRTFSNRFLVAWSNLLFQLLALGAYDIKVSNQYSSFVSFARAKCLGASVLRGPGQAPFGGALDYDVLVWIDSDIVFTPEQVIELVESTLRDHPVVSGLYRMEDGHHLACVRALDDATFLRLGGTYAFETLESLQQYAATTRQTYLPCAYAGMGFMGIRRGVLERLPYPWFHRPLQRVATGDPAVPELVDQCSEDVALCRNLVESKIVPAIMVKLTLRVGHEKTVVL